jgi:hypothetical protein
VRVNQVAMKRSLANNTITEEQHKRHTIFIPWFSQVTLAYFHVVASQLDEGCTQPLSSDPMINLNTMVFSLLSILPVCEESPQVGASRPYNIDHKESTRVRMGEKHTQDPNPQHTQAKTWAQNTTQRVYNSNGAQITNTIDQMRGGGDWET